MAASVFPHHLFMEILRYIPTKFLGKLRAVSKECKESIDHSYFKTQHQQLTNTISGFLLQSLKYNKSIVSLVSSDSRNIKFSLDFLPGYDPSVLAVTTHGLILCETQNLRTHQIPSYTVCKPCTKEYRKLPNPKTRFFTKHTSMAVTGTNPLRFKIVRLSESPLPSTQVHSTVKRYFCEVFDSEKWRWKRLEDVLIPYRTLFLHNNGVWASGSVHWPMSDDTILRFDINEEQWSRFAMPDAVDQSWQIVKLAEYRGKLSLISMAEIDHSCMGVFVMENYSKKAWKKEKMKTTTVSNEGIMENRRHWPTAMAFQSSDVIVLWGCNKVIFLNMELGVWNMSRCQSHMAPEIFPFWSDSEPLQLPDSGPDFFPVKGRRCGDLDTQTKQIFVGKFL